MLSKEMDGIHFVKLCKILPCKESQDVLEEGCSLVVTSAELRCDDDCAVVSVSSVID